MYGVRNNATMEMVENTLDDLHSGNKAVVVILVHKPSCPHCRNYYSHFNELCERLPGLCGDKGSAMSIDFDDASEEMQDDTEFVPRVILLSSSGDGIVKREDLDEHTRKIDSLIPMIEKIMDEREPVVSRSPMISLSPMTSSTDKPKKDKTTKKPKKKTMKKTMKKATKKATKKPTKKDQEGKGFVEAALATAILGGGANLANQSPAVKKYLKKTESGLIGLSKASSDLAEGSFKVLTEQDMMKKLANVTKSLANKKKQNKSKNKRSKTRKVSKSRKRSQKTRKNN